MAAGVGRRSILVVLAGAVLAVSGFAAWPVESALAAKKCTVPKGAVAYGPWRVTLRSFTRDGSALIAPPAGRVTMALEVVVSSTKVGDITSNLLDINLIPTGSRKYRGTVVRGAEAAATPLAKNAKAVFTLAYPVEAKDRTKALSVQLDDFSGAVAAEKLIPVC